MSYKGGWVADEEDPGKVCPTCDGTGEVMYADSKDFLQLTSCPNCKGAGSVAA